MPIEDFILGILDGAGSFNFGMLIQSIGIGLLVLWFFVMVWVWIDSGLRSTNTVFRVVSVIIVGVFNLVGLIIYFLIRPRSFKDDDYWTDLERRYLLYETSQLGDCESCGFHLNPGFNVCPNCSYPIRRECQKCELLINKEWQFCPYCSTIQKPLENIDEIDMKAASLITGMSLENKNAEVRSKDSIIEKEISEDDPEGESEVSQSQIKPDSIGYQEQNETIQNHINEQLEAGVQPKAKTNILSKIGTTAISTVYLFGEKIHKTALKLSGPTSPVGDVKIKNEDDVLGNLDTSMQEDHIIEQKSDPADKHNNLDQVDVDSSGSDSNSSSSKDKSKKKPKTKSKRKSKKKKNK